MKSFECISPSNISDKEKKIVCGKQFQRLVQFLSGHSIVFNTIGDKSFQGYSELILTGEEIGKWSEFDRKAERLDGTGFFLKKFDIDKMQVFWAIVKQVLIEEFVWIKCY